MNRNALICTFHVGEHHYGVPVDKVQEVLPNHPITGMPLAPPAIVGLMNIRGQIVPAVSMRRVLGLADQADSESTMNVVVRHDDSEVSLVVDGIGDIITASTNDIEPVPETLKHTLRRLISGVIPMTGTLLLLLDIQATLSDEHCRQLPANPGTSSTP